MTKNSNENWFEVHKFDDYITVFRERLDLIDDRFRIKYTNLFLINGLSSAILLDTGMNYASIKSAVEEVIGKKPLKVINSHNHFDHCVGNVEFDEIFGHPDDLVKMNKEMKLSFLEKSSQERARKYFNNPTPRCKKQTSLNGNEIFDLGGISVKVIFTPGHTPGSVCLFTSKQHFLLGDTVHYGINYLPGTMKQIDQYNITLRAILDIIQKEKKEVILFPGHEKFHATTNLVKLMINLLEKAFDTNLNELKQLEFVEFANSYLYKSKEVSLLIDKDSLEEESSLK